MKKSLIPVLAVLCLTGVLNAQAEDPSILYITSTTDIDVSPDICYISVVVENYHKDADQAYLENNQTMDKLKQAIQNQGVAAKDMKTTNFYMEAMYDYNNRGKAKFTEYYVSHNLFIKVRDLSKVSQIIDEAVKNDASYLYDVVFAIEDTEKYIDDIRDEAYQKARKKAETIARLTGVTLGKPLYIEEYEPGDYYGYGDYGYYPQTGAMDYCMNGGEMAASIPIEQGEINLSLTVNISYRIE